MTVEDLLASLNDFLLRQGQPALGRQEVLFAWDEDVVYDGLASCRVPRSRLHSAQEFDPLLRDRTQGGPSWIHSNLLPPTPHPTRIITVRVGALVGNPSPSVNVSAERDSFDVALA